jgi:hypothetical protein
VRRRIGGNHAGCSDELSCGRVERTRNQPGALSLFNYFNLIMAHDNDPREHALESSFTIPQTWSSQDNLGSCLFCPSPPLHSHSLRRQLRRARDFGHVSRRSHHGHPEQVTTYSIPYHHPLTHNGMLHRILAWPSLLLGLSAWINQHPLRTREGTTPPIGNLMYGSLSLVSHLRP